MLDEGAQPLGLMVALVASLEIVIELAAHQIAGLLLDAGVPRRPVERARLPQHALVGSTPPRRVLGTAGQRIGDVPEGIRLRPGQLI